jgi:hypothetical protein
LFWRARIETNIMSVNSLLFNIEQAVRQRSIDHALTERAGEFMMGTQYSTQTARELTRVTRSALGILLLTSIHHAYGAYAYNTPWRLHVVIVSALVIAVMLPLRWAIGRASDRLAGIAFWSFAAIVLVMPVGLIGGFEGVYNHAAKNMLYFGGASPSLMTRLFPPPTYELPNDLVFELTGTAQAIWGVIAGYQLLVLIRAHQRSARSAQGAASHGWAFRRAR